MYTYTKRKKEQQQKLEHLIGKHPIHSAKKVNTVKKHII